MFKKFMSLSLASAIVVGTSVQAVAAPETTTNNIQENKAKYKALGNEILDLNAQLSNLNVQIEQLNAQTQENNAKMQETTQKINETKTQIDNVQKEIDAKQKILGVRLAAMYKNEVDFNPITFLISSNSLSDFFSRLEAYRKIISLDDNLISGLNQNKQTLNNDMTSMKNKEQELSNLQAENEKNLATLNEKKESQKTTIDKLNAQRNSVLSVITENENSLISYSVDIINSSNPSIDQLKSAVSSLNEILPQLSVDSVINTAKAAINTGNSKIQKIEAQQKAAQEKAAQEQAQKAAQEQAQKTAQEQAQKTAQEQAQKESQQSSNVSSNNTSSNNNTSNNNSSSNSNNGSSSSNNSPTNGYRKVLSMTATAYTGGTLTAMGLKPVRNPNGISTIAVDPSVIPLGSKVYIPGYGYAIASDTGGAIKGDIIDLYMNSEAACNSWGRRPVTVYIVAYPGQW